MFSFPREAAYNSAISAYGMKELKNAGWYEAHWEEMKPETEAKRKTLLVYKPAPNPSTLDTLIAARVRSQLTARSCANIYWLNVCRSIRSAANTENVRGM